MFSNIWKIKASPRVFFGFIFLKEKRPPLDRVFGFIFMKIKRPPLECVFGFRFLKEKKDLTWRVFLDSEFF